MEERQAENQVTTDGTLPSSELTDVAGAAEYLHVSEPFIRRLVKERRIRYYKVGWFLRFRRLDLDEFRDAGRVDPLPREAAG